jgi:hypothetical protein
LLSPKFVHIYVATSFCFPTVSVTQSHLNQQRENIQTNAAYNNINSNTAKSLRAALGNPQNTDAAGRKQHEKI